MEEYFIIQDSRENNTSLLLVDRRKSKQFFWTHNGNVVANQDILSNVTTHNGNIICCGKIIGDVDTYNGDIKHN